jgi:hypothetical protein
MTPEKILSIAIHQKHLLTCFALLVLFTVLALCTRAPVAQGFRTPVIAIYSLIAIFTVFWAFMLTNDLKDNMLIALIVALCLLLPFFNLLILMAVNLEATKVLKDNGVPVGFSGADITPLKNRLGMQAAGGETSPSKTASSH